MKSRLFSLCVCMVLSCFHSAIQAQSTDTVFYYPDGTVSSVGKMVNGLPDGYWKTYHPNGNIRSEGNRVNKLLDGTWVFYDSEGRREKEINYSSGLKQGDEIHYTDGVMDKKTPYDKNIRQGVSLSYYPDGKVKRRDNYMNDLLYGRSVIYDTTGVVMTVITYKDGVSENMMRVNRRDSQGKKSGLWVWFYDDTYAVEHQGTYSRGLRHGFFKYYDRSGRLLRSEKYINDHLEENAVETSSMEIKREYYPSKKLKSYKSYRNGKKEGISIYYSPFGEVDSVMIYHDDVLSEKGESISPEGFKKGMWHTYTSAGEKISQGAYKDGEMTGVWKHYHPDGSIYGQGEYVSGKQNGRWLWYYPTGEVMREENYIRGKEEGMSIQYSSAGDVISQGMYEGGLRQGEWFFINDETRDTGNYSDGLKNGVWKQHDTATGKVVFFCVYREGIMNGECTLYYTDGRKRAEGTFTDGIRSGVWKFYDTDGILITQVDYNLTGN